MKVVNVPIWIGKYGQQTLVPCMDDQHLLNSIAMLERWALNMPLAKDPERLDYLQSLEPALIAEAFRRGLAPSLSARQWAIRRAQPGGHQSLQATINLGASRTLDWFTLKTAGQINRHHAAALREAVGAIQAAAAHLETQ